MRTGGTHEYDISKILGWFIFAYYHAGISSINFQGRGRAFNDFDEFGPAFETLHGLEWWEGSGDTARD